MKTSIYHRFDCAKAQGVCIVIDVLRAFTTAAFAFAAGAKEIIMVSSPKEAFQKQLQDHSLILMGEDEGKHIPGFHYENSPSELQSASVVNRTIVQRTSSGTQGVVACQHAEHMLVSSFVVAEATLKRIMDLKPSHVSFIVTGRNNGDEDLALAEYLQLKLSNSNTSAAPFLDRVRHSPGGRKMSATNPPVYKLAQQDLELAIQLDRFPFAMEVFKQNGEFVAKQQLIQ